MNPRTAGRLAWGLLGVTVAGALVQAWLRIPHVRQLAEARDPFLTFPIITLACVVAGIVGALIVSRHPSNAVGWLFCVSNCIAELGLTAGAVTDHSALRPAPIPGASYAAWFESQTGSNFALSCLVFLLLLFPTGHLPSRRWRPVAWLAGANAVALAVMVAVLVGSPADAVPPRTMDVPPTLALLITVGQLVMFACLLAGVGSVISRRRNATGVVRQQLRVFVLGAGFLAVALVMVVASDVLAAIGVPRAVPETLLYLAYGALPVTCGLAMLRYRLYDVDLLLNRTVAFTALAATTTAVYVAVVVLLGAVVGTGLHAGSTASVLLTAAVAVLVQPLRSRMRRLADRLVYGRRASPYEVLAAFSGQVGDAVSVDELPARLAEAATSGLGARSATVRVLLEDGGERSAHWPPGSDPAGADVIVPVLHAGEHVGDICLDLPEGSRPSTEQAELLATVAGQVGLALRNVRLTAELRRRVRSVAAQNEALERSRKRLVTAATAERQRFQRRLSAAVLPHLHEVAVGLEQLEASGADPAAAARRCDALIEAAGSAIDTLRDIARGLFPPVLAEHGLRAALSAARPTTGDVFLDLAPDLPRLAPVTEATAYFCCADLFAAAVQSSESMVCHVALDDDVLRIRVDSAVAAAIAAASEDRVAAAGGHLSLPEDHLAGTAEIVLPAEAAAAPRVLSPSVGG